MKEKFHFGCYFVKSERKIQLPDTWRCDECVLFNRSVSTETWKNDARAQASPITTSGEIIIIGGEKTKMTSGQARRGQQSRAKWVAEIERAIREEEVLGIGSKNSRRTERSSDKDADQASQSVVN